MRPTTAKLRNYSIIGTESIKEPVPESIALTRLYLYQLTYWELVRAYFIKVIDTFKIGLESLQTFYRHFLRVEVLILLVNVGMLEKYFTIVTIHI